MTRAATLEHVECVLFDLDGTLVDSIELILASFRHATAEVLGEPLSDDDVLVDVGIPLAQQMNRISPHHAQDLLTTYRTFNAANHDAMIKEYPGTLDTLRWLDSNGYAIGVVTSKMHQMASRGLEIFGLGEFVGVLVGADDVEIHKPDPHPLHVAAEILGTTLDKCIYVGDSPHDMAAASRGGAVAIAALWGPFDPKVVVSAGADYALESITGLPALLGAGSDDVAALCVN